MVIRSHNGDFVEAKVTTLPRPNTVLEAESIGIREALSWVLQRGEQKLIVESDLLLSVRAVQHKKNRTISWRLGMSLKIARCSSILCLIIGLQSKLTRLLIV